MPGERALFWVGSTLEDLRTFPDSVIDVMGYALHLAQQGDTQTIEAGAGTS